MIKTQEQYEWDCVGKFIVVGQNGNPVHKGEYDVWFRNDEELEQATQSTRQYLADRASVDAETLDVVILHKHNRNQ